MNWLSCNNCYDIFEKSNNNFSMTECGHIYCVNCFNTGGAKCPECGRIVFRSMQLTRPPKLETMVNYFSPIKDILDYAEKAIRFNSEQFYLFLRGYKKKEKKYQYFKKTVMKLTYSCKELHNEQIKQLNARKELIGEIRATEQKSTKNAEIPVRMEVEGSEVPRFTDEGSRGAKYPFKNLPGHFIERKRSSRVTGDQSSTKFGFKSSLRSIPESPFGTCNEMSSVSYASMSESCSERGSERGSVRRGEFVVPTIRSVPRSVASMGRRSASASSAGTPNENSIKSSRIHSKYT